ISFGLAATVGLIITLITQQWWFIAVGFVCIIAAWFYTGGKKPYGYSGLGEVVVFIFFGLVATIGTDYIQVLDLNPLALIAGCIAGCFATAVLLINNIRDIETDRIANKKTLASRIGRKASLVLFDLLILLPFGIVVIVWSLVPILIVANTAKTPKDLILALQLTSYLSLAFAIIFSWGLFQITF
ncbi:MAG: hypothetical protein RIQ88_706, partial [Actinomycetota bacterium]